MFFISFSTNVLCILNNDYCERCVVVLTQKITYFFIQQCEKYDIFARKCQR